MNRLRRSVVLLVLPAALSIPAALVAQQAPVTGFTHAKHAKLFPTCVGCHAGVPTGDAAQTFPAAASCASCHDGLIQPRATWVPVARRGAGLLVYSHPAHAAKAAEATCLTCHTADGKSWMITSRAAPERCGSCHTHAAPAHLADESKCSTCHRPLTAATALSDRDILALPKPPSHLTPRFVSAHGAAANAATANCATCHARESCVRCHVDAGRSAPIQALRPDARVARSVAGMRPTYPTPVSHVSREFGLTHGVLAMASDANCATCHARPSCETCHTGDGARDALRRIPAARDAASPGVQLRRAGPTGPPAAAGQVFAAAWTPQPHGQDTTRRQVRVHPNAFSKSHGRAAASGELSCEGCHAKKFCSDCHTGERVSRGYHPVNFVSTHAPQAYNRETNCSACHSTVAFCTSCHQQAGLVARSDARSATFHNARPLWLLQHGQAARQDLMACTTCHKQTYCMQCHSDLGSRINPHGPGFDAARMASRNSRICLACHLKNPLEK